MVKIEFFPKSLTLELFDDTEQITMNPDEVAQLYLALDQEREKLLDRCIATVARERANARREYERKDADLAERVTELRSRLAKTGLPETGNGPGTAAGTGSS